MIIHIFSIMVLLILLWWQYQDIMIDKKVKKYSIYCIVLTLIVVFAETGCKLTDNTVPENRVWSILFNVIGFGVSPFVFLVESRFYYLRNVKKHIWFYIPAFFNLLLVIASPFTNWIFCVTKDCRYGRGKLFPVYLVVFAFSVFVSLWRKMEAIQNYPRYFRARIVGSTGFMLLGLLVQVLSPMYSVSWIIISVYLVLYYALACEMGSMLDGLTGLLNRTAYNKMIEKCKVQKNRQHFLIMLDVNNFKTVNDTKGHVYGDFCLKEIAAMLMEVFEVNAHVFRLGGDEFSVLLWTRQDSDIETYITEIEKRTAERKRLYEAFPEIAIGYERIEAGKELKEVIDTADAKMYQNKQRMKAAHN
ncbi:MAG: GGDEF domain-containing protein [Lachnospiraceae bacterium]|nr:GGDEF domain-containing protein [Lachnospiraceae bacterium]